MKWREKVGELHPKRFFLETWKEIDAEAEEERKQSASYDFTPALAFLFGGLFLVLMEYWGDYRSLRQLIEWSDPSGTTMADFRLSPWYQLINHGWWAIWRVIGFFILPICVIKLSGKRIREQGLATAGFLDHLWIYILSYVVVLICVIFVSFDAHFTDYYPFYRQSHRSWFDFLTWEMLYAAQFFSLEFFFRGWWLKAGKRMMGSHAIFVMTVPYVMIHFGKPMLETVGAIIAGVVLGTLAMKTRSIWSGFLIHVSVALSMDLASMIQRNAWPTVFWPILEQIR